MMNVCRRRRRGGNEDDYIVKSDFTFPLSFERGVLFFVELSCYRFRIVFRDC